MKTIASLIIAAVSLGLAGCCHSGGGYGAYYPPAGGGCPGGACGVGAAPGGYPTASAPGYPQTGFYNSYGTATAAVPAGVPVSSGPVAFQPTVTYPSTAVAMPVNPLPTY